jgi:O-antigen ligase
VDAPLSDTTIGTRARPRVPIADPARLLAGTGASFAIVALGLADGGYAPAGWWTATFGFAVLTVAALVLDPRFRLGALPRMTIAALALLTLWTAASAAWAPERELAITDARRDILYVAVLVALLRVARPDGRALTQGTLAGIVALTGVALAMFLLPLGSRSADPFEGYLLSEPIGYANAVGVVAAVGVVLSLLMATAYASLSGKRACATSATICSAALALSGSRASALAVVVGVGIVLALTQDRRSIVRALLALAPGAALALALCALVDVKGVYPAFDTGRSAALAAGLVCAALIAAIAAPLVDTFLDNRPAILGRAAIGCGVLAIVACTGLATHVGAIADTRVEYWRVAFDMARDRPLLGAGSGSFGSFWQASGADRGARDAHGAFTEAVAELGLPGLFLLSVALLTPLIAGIRARRTPWAAVATGAYAATLLHSALDWDRELPVVVVVSSALAASMLAADARQSPSAASTLSGRARTRA